jgi:hypothetical protein
MFCLFASQPSAWHFAFVATHHSACPALGLFSFFSIESAPDALSGSSAALEEPSRKDFSHNPRPP